MSQLCIWEQPRMPNWQCQQALTAQQLICSADAGRNFRGRRVQQELADVSSPALGRSRGQSSIQQGWDALHLVQTQLPSRAVEEGLGPGTSYLIVVASVS